ncbi:LysE family translocator [Janibacter corallicola]|uniref:LysE family translocator n=1 Tax=Janibacter corallicola TaxID=415212 RepID=UPI000B2F292A|nr:LysE family translocator [Janibacter corallicola]
MTLPTLATLLAFGGATLAIVALPGPSVLYVVTRSLEHGRAAGLCSVLGIEAGALVHVAAATAGLAAVLERTPVALDLLRWGGAAYLLWLALRELRGGGQGAGPAGAAPSRRQLFREGLVVDLLNPKTALFFLAFLPQFVDPHRGPMTHQLASLGLCFVLLALCCDGAYALGAGGLATRVQSSARGARLVRVGACLTYISLAVVAVAA